MLLHLACATGVFGALLHVKDAELRRINAVEDEEEVRHAL